MIRISEQMQQLQLQRVARERERERGRERERVLVRCRAAIWFHTLNSIRILALCALYLPLSRLPSLSPLLLFALLAYLARPICLLPFASLPGPVKVIRKMQFSHGTCDKSVV